MIARLKHGRFGVSSERSRKLVNHMELELEEIEAAASEDATAVAALGGTEVTAFTLSKPALGHLPEHLPRERGVIAASSACSGCCGKLAKLGEDITETLEMVPRQWKVIQTVLRGDRPTACPAPPDRPQSCRTWSLGHDPRCQVRPAPAAHARRKFFELAEMAKAALATRRIDAIFAIECDINGIPPDRRRARAARYRGWSKAWLFAGSDRGGVRAAAV